MAESNMSHATPTVTPADRTRFAAKVNENGPIPPHRPELGPCHVWTGAVSKPDGYGRFGFGRRVFLAHRVAFLLADGRWPAPCGLHRCDNRACVRREHLFEGTYSDNAADMAQKARVAHGERSGRARMRASDVVAIRAACARGETARSIASRFGVSVRQAQRAARGADWKRVGGALGERRRKLNEAAVCAIRASTETLDVLAERFAVDRSLVHLVRKGKIWRHI